MANFFNRNKNLLDEYAQNIQPLQPMQNTILPGYQLDNSGNLQNVDMPAMNSTSLFDRLVNPVKQKTANIGSKLSDMLLGKQAQATDTIDTSNGAINATISENPRTGGLLRDMASGYQENRFTPASLNNFGQNTTLDGRKKGFGYRLGEGLGSLARFGESPLGRSLIVGGLVGATGGNPLEMLVYGAQTGALNQQNRAADQMYRNQLKDNYGYSDEDLANIRGYINRNDFNTIANNAYRQNALNVRQNIASAKDNVSKAKMIMQALNNGTMSPQEAQLQMAQYGISVKDLKESNQTRNADINERLAPAKEYALYTAPQVALGNLGVNQARLQEQIAQNDFNNMLKLEELKKPDEKQQNLRDIENQLNNFKATFENLPSKFESYTTGALRGVTGTQTEKEANFNAQRTLLFNQIARTLGGEKGVLSDNDIKRIEAALPTLTDSYEQKNAKMKAVYDLLNIKKGQTQNKNTYSSGKYTVRVK